MKVLFAAPSANTMVGGGASIQLQRTAQFLPAQGIEVQFFDPWRPYRKGEVDLVHIFKADMATFDLARHLAEQGIPYVVSPVFFTLHAPWFLRITRRMENLSKRVVGGLWSDYGFTGRVCEMSEAALPNTRLEADLIVRGLGIPREKVTVVPNGVDARFGEGDARRFREKYGLDSFILNVANIGSYRKNALGLIRALAGIDHPAVIIGKIYQNDYAQRCLAEAAQNKNLLIIDAIDNTDPLLAAAYAACSVFVLPAYFETPGIAALEAALAGARIVITRNGGTREYFADDAAYVNPKSVTDIRRGITQALNAAPRPQLADRIRRDYLWPTIAAHTAAAYRKHLAHRH